MGDVPGVTFQAVTIIRHIQAAAVCARAAVAHAAAARWSADCPRHALRSGFFPEIPLPPLSTPIACQADRSYCLGGGEYG